MIIKIDRKIYNTETADLIAETAKGSYGDSTGFEEILYKRGPRDYFLFGHGGDQSPYPQPGLFVLSAEDALAWLTRVAGEEIANNEFGIKKATTRKPAAKKVAEVIAEPVVQEEAPVKKVSAKKEKAAKAEKADKVVKAEKAEKAPKAPKTPKTPKAPKA